MNKRHRKVASLATACLVLCGSAWAQPTNPAAPLTNQKGETQNTRNRDFFTGNALTALRMPPTQFVFTMEVEL